MQFAVHLVIYSLAAAIGVLALLYSLNPGWQLPVAAWFTTAGGQAVLCSLAGVFLGAPMLLFVLWWRAMLRSREISYTTESGRISVNLAAIEEALTRALEGEPEVKKAHVRVVEDRVKRTVLIDAVMTLWEVPDVTERNRFCQRLLRRRFAELMPEQNAVLVNLNIHRLNVRRPESRVPAAPVPAAIPLAPAPPPRRSIGDDSGARLPIEPTDGDLYVGPSYPVARDDDEGSGHAYQTRPTTVRVVREEKKAEKTR